MAKNVLVSEAVEIPELPNLEDVKHPVLKRAMIRLQEMQKEGSTEIRGHNRNHNRHDRSQSPYW